MVRVMVVEASDSLREALEVLLREAGYAVAPGAGDVVKAHLALSSSRIPPNVAIIDSWLPRGRASALARTLQERGVEVILTGADEEEGRRMAEELGVPFLVKPFTMEELVRVVEEVTQGRQGGGSGGVSG